MEEELFRGSRLKLKRAIHHVLDLNTRAWQFLPGDTYEVLVDRGPDGDVLSVKDSKSVPEDFPLILGDALHNLRAALDYAVNDLEFAHSGKRTKYTKFPVYKTKAELVDAVNGGPQQKVAQPVIDFIVKTVQPYERGTGDAIWRLHKLDIEDKHRLLIGQLCLTSVKGICAKDGKGIEIAIPDWLAVEGKVAPHTLSGHTNVVITDKGRSESHWVFGPDTPLAGQPILQGLRVIAESVRHAVEGMQKVSLESLGIDT